MTYQGLPPNSATATALAVSLHGLPAIALGLPDGSRATISLQGAQVLSWADGTGVERLYLSPRAVYDGGSALRGGIPLCFPQFNQRVIESRPLPKHGFARILPWRIGPVQCEAAHVTQTLVLTHDDLPVHLRQAWPFRFEAHVAVQLAARRLTVNFSLRNLDQVALPFALALHTYFRVGDIAATGLEGLQDALFWDAVAHPATPDQRQSQHSQSLTFTGETDRVYKTPARPLVIREASTSLSIEQSAGFSETVVWNPGEALCRQLADMPQEGYRHMLCVEAARIDEPVMLAPDAQWQGSQTLTIC